LYGSDRRLDRRLGRRQKDRGLAAGIAHFAQQFYAGPSGKIEVRDDYVEIFSPERGGGFVERRGRFGEMSTAAKPSGRGLGVASVTVGYENPERSGAHSARESSREARRRRGILMVGRSAIHDEIGCGLSVAPTARFGSRPGRMLRRKTQGNRREVT